MSYRRSVLFKLAIFSAFISLGSAGFAQNSSSPSGGLSLGDALNASLNPYAEVDRYDAYVPLGAKGIVQRSFFDFSSAQQAIQLAFVIDATSTMRTDIDSLKETLSKFIDGITKQVRSVDRPSDVDVEIAVIIYRDLLVSSVPLKRRDKPVEILTGGDEGVGGFLLFSEDAERLTEILSSITLESGDPGFPEQVDRGLFAALNDLNWSAEKNVTRIILLAGDAPPWDEKYLDSARQPAWWQNQSLTLRGHSDAELQEIANNKEIAIYSVACNSGIRADVRAAIEKRYKAPLADFFGSVANSTQGVFLDLWTPDQVERLVDATSQSAALPVLVELKNIEASEFEDRLQQSQVRLAVLPPLPLESMKFSSYDSGACDLAIDLVLRMQRIEGRSTVDLATLQRGWKEFTTRQAPSEAGLVDLARQLDVDFVIWGTYREQDDKSTVQWTAYGAGQQRITAPEVTAPIYELAGTSMTAMVQSFAAHDDAAASAVAKLFAKHNIGQHLQISYTEDNEVHAQLMNAYDILEQAAEFVAQNSVADVKNGQVPNAGRDLNLKARELLQQVVDAEPENAFALMLLSNCLYNLGEQDAGNSYLTQAHELGERNADDDLRLEIAGDYALFVQADHKTAIANYEELVQTTQSREPKAALRARWMLCGLYLGDWGAAKTVQEMFAGRDDDRLDLARAYILDILVYWPESPQARFYARFVDPKPELKPRHESASPTKYVRHEIYNISVPIDGQSRLVQSQPQP